MRRLSIALRFLGITLVVCGFLAVGRMSSSPETFAPPGHDASSWYHDMHAWWVLSIALIIAGFVCAALGDALRRRAGGMPQGRSDAG